MSDSNSHHTPAAYCIHISSSCLAVALPGSGPTGRWPAVVFEVAHESSEIWAVQRRQTAQTPLGCLVSSCVFVVTWPKHITHAAYSTEQLWTSKDCMTHWASLQVTWLRKEPKEVRHMNSHQYDKKKKLWLEESLDPSSLSCDPSWGSRPRSWELLTYAQVPYNIPLILRMLLYICLISPVGLASQKLTN